MGHIAIHAFLGQKFAFRLSETLKTTCVDGGGSLKVINIIKAQQRPRAKKRDDFCVWPQRNAHFEPKLAWIARVASVWCGRVAFFEIWPIGGCPSHWRVPPGALQLHVKSILLVTCYSSL